MNPKILFIEGNPGSGKTTFSKRLSETLSSQGYRVKSYQEGDLHPIDLAWIAILDSNTFKRALKAYPMLKEDILKYSKKIDDSYYLAYTKVDYQIAPKSYYETMAEYEIFKENNLDIFFSAYKKLYLDFARMIEPNTIYIFECILIQNHINQLILRHNLDKEAMIRYFKDLINPLLPYQPLLLFIKQLDVRKSIEKVSIERKSYDLSKFPDWITRVIDYIKAMPYGQSMGYKDYESIIQYFKDRQTKTLDLLKKLPINYEVFNLNDDYDDTFEAIKVAVDKSISKPN
ncbi:MAG: hypothetical protein ACLFRI_03260 [Candidatus Izemoplasmataceae bacterium]